MPDPADERNPPAAEATPEAATPAHHAPAHHAPGHDPTPAEPDTGAADIGAADDEAVDTGAADDGAVGAGVADEPEPPNASDLAPDAADDGRPVAAESPADLVRPYVARHHQVPRVAGDLVTDEISANARLDDQLDDPSDVEVQGRHGLDPSAFADTAEFPLFLLDGDDAEEPDPDATAGLGRRTLVAVGVAVLAILATLVGVALATPHTPPVALEPTAPATTVIEPTDASAGPVQPVPTTVAPSASAAATSRPTPAPTRVAPPPTTRPAPTPAPTPTPAGRTGPITSRLAGRCADLPGNNANPGVAVQSFACNGTTAQIWTVAPDGSLQVRGLCLQPAGQSAAAGAKMVVGVCDGSTAQRYQITTGGRIKQGTLCLTIPGNSTSDIQLTMDTCQQFNANGQRWATP